MVRTIRQYLTSIQGDITLFDQGSAGFHLDRLYPQIMENLGGFSFPCGDVDLSYLDKMFYEEQETEFTTQGRIPVYSAGLHYGEEALVGLPTGAIFFRGCKLGCTFCSDWNAIYSKHRVNVGLTVEGLCNLIDNLVSCGAKSIDLVNPDLHVDDIIFAIKHTSYVLHSPNWGIPVVWNTHGYGLSADDRFKILSTVDTVCLDVKFSDGVATQLSSGKNYMQQVMQFLEEALMSLGPAEPNYPDTDTFSGVYLRYLVMPGCAADAVKVFEAISQVAPTRIPIHIMDQYVPVMGGSGLHDCAITNDEYDVAVDAARSFGFDNLLLDR